MSQAWSSKWRPSEKKLRNENSQFYWIPKILFFRRDWFYGTIHFFPTFPCQLTPSYSLRENSLSLGLCPNVAKDYYHLCRCSPVSGQPTLSFKSRNRWMLLNWMQSNFSNLYLEICCFCLKPKMGLGNQILVCFSNCMLVLGKIQPLHTNPHNWFLSTNTR